MLQEVKSMDRVRKLGVPAPGVYLVDLTERKIYSEYLQDAITVKQFLMSVPFNHKGKLNDVMCSVLVIGRYDCD